MKPKSCHSAHRESAYFLQELPTDERDMGNDALLRHIQKGRCQSDLLSERASKAFNPVAGRLKGLA
jgi:hypothetical protein